MSNRPLERLPIRRIWPTAGNASDIGNVNPWSEKLTLCRVGAMDESH